MATILIERMDDDLHAELKIKAIKEGISMRDGIIEAIKEWVAADAGDTSQK